MKKCIIIIQWKRKRYFLRCFELPEDEISFIRSPAKHGKDDYVFTIPREYLRKGLIDPELKYKITVKIFRDERQHVLQLINALEQKFIMGGLEKEEYYRLMHKLEEKLI